METVKVKVLLFERTEIFNEDKFCTACRELCLFTAVKESFDIALERIKEVFYNSTLTD